MDYNNFMDNNFMYNDFESYMNNIPIIPIHGELYHIIDNIYLSNVHDARNISLIKKNNINMVFRLSENDNKNIYENNILFYNYIIEDHGLFVDKLIELAKKIFLIIEENNDKNILIHCNAGISRSVSIIIYYLMKKHNYKFDDALKHIQKIKEDANPNHQFKQGLRNLKF